MKITKDFNFWEHLKNGIGIDVVKNNIKIVQAAPTAEEIEEEISNKTIIEILKEVGLDNKYDLLEGQYSKILLSPKVFESDIQNQIKNQIDKEKNKLKNKIANSNVIKSIDKLIAELEKCEGLVEQAATEAGKIGKEALNKQQQEFVKQWVQKKEDDDDDDEGGFEN